MEDSAQPLEYQRGRLPGDRYIRRPLRRALGLRRVLGVAGLFSSAYGDVGSSIYYALGVTALHALGLTPAVFIFSGLFFACTALTYAEGTAAIPESGGSASFARRGFNELVSFIAGWAQILNYAITIAISAFAVPNYLAFFFSPLKTWPLNSLVGVGLIGGLAYLNIRGLKESAGMNIVLAILDLATQIVLVLLGLFLLLNLDLLFSNIRPGEAPTWPDLLFGISISMIAYTGIETVSNLAEETRNPARNIPLSVGLVFLAVITLYALLPGVALSAMPVQPTPEGRWSTELGTTWVQDPVMGVVNHMPGALPQLLGVWVAILAATILLIATNAAILGLSRLAYSMGQYRQLPPLLQGLHPQHHTPYVAIALFSAFAMLVVIPGQVELLADLYSFGAMLSFSLAHLSIIALRLRQPQLARPFKAPLGLKIGRREIPLTAVIGGTGTFLTWIVVLVTHQVGRWVGLGWLLGGLVLYFWYRRAIGHSPLATLEPERRFYR